MSEPAGRRLGDAVEKGRRASSAHPFNAVDVRVGSSTDFALRYLVQKNGIKFLPGCPWQKDTPSRS